MTERDELDERIAMRCSAAQRQELEARARAEHLRLSVWLRRVALREVERQERAAA